MVNFEKMVKFFGFKPQKIVLCSDCLFFISSAVVSFFCSLFFASFIFLLRTPFEVFASLAHAFLSVLQGDPINFLAGYHLLMSCFTDPLSHPSHVFLIAIFSPPWPLTPDFTGQIKPSLPGLLHASRKGNVAHWIALLTGAFHRHSLDHHLQC
jgi:hypothetical protein